MGKNPTVGLRREVLIPVVKGWPLSFFLCLKFHSRLLVWVACHLQLSLNSRILFQELLITGAWLTDLIRSCHIRAGSRWSLHSRSSQERKFPRDFQKDSNVDWKCLCLQSLRADFKCCPKWLFHMEINLPLHNFYHVINDSDEDYQHYDGQLIKQALWVADCSTELHILTISRRS